MTVTASLLVDSVRQNEEGAVDLIGLVEGFRFPSLPVTVEEMLLFSSARPFVRRSGRFRQAGLSPLRARRPAARAGKPPDREEFRLWTTIPRPTPPCSPQLSLTFHQPGVHRLEIRANGEPLHSFPILVYPQ